MMSGQSADNMARNGQRPPVRPPVRPATSAAPNRAATSPFGNMVRQEWNNSTAGQDWKNDVRSQGYSPSFDFYRNAQNGIIWDQNSSQPAAQDAPSYGGGGGYGGGGSGNPAARAAAEQAIRTMFGAYNRQDPGFQEAATRPDDGVLMGELNKLYGQAQTAGASASDRLRSALSSQENSYRTQLSSAAPAATNAMESYMGASGASTDQVDALRAMLSQGSADTRNAEQAMMDRSAASWDRQQNDRLLDVDVSRAAFAQQLEAQRAGYGTQVAGQRQSYVDQVAEQNRTGRQAYDQQARQSKDAMMESILKMAIESGIDLSALGISF